MAEDRERNISEQAARNRRKPILQSSFDRRASWTDFDAWLLEEPRVRRAQFQVVKSAILLHTEYTTIVMNEIEESGNIIEEYAHFIKLANQTNFVCGDAPAIVNVFTLLAELYSTTPKFKSETGKINSFLKRHLENMLPAGFDWTNLRFSVNIFRSVYWQLLFTLHLAPVHSENDTEESMVHDVHREMLIFGCFVLAVTVAVCHDNEGKIERQFSSYHKSKVEDFLSILAPSSLFQSLSLFFLFGLRLITKYRTQGGSVTVVNEPGQTVEIESTDTDPFQNYICDRVTSDDHVFVVPQNAPNNIQRAWEIRAISMLKKGLLQVPDGFKIVQKGGRPRKYLPTQIRKRQLDEATTSNKVEETLQQVQTPLPNTTEKLSKYTMKKKLKDTRKSIKVGQEYSSLEPSASFVGQRPSVSSVVVPSKSARKVVPSADEVGLLPPIYVMQAELLKSFKEEVKRRKVEGLSVHDIARVRNIVYESYDEIFRIARLSGEEPHRNLTSEQKLVMNQFKTAWRSGNATCPDDCGIEDEEEKGREEEKVPEIVVNKTTKNTAKPSKKWKRRY